MIDDNGTWYPTMFPKQVEAYNDNAIYRLLSGPRYCGKTIIAVHIAIKHAFLTDRDLVGIVTRSTKVGKTGIWGDLQVALEEWEQDVGGFEIIRNTKSNKDYFIDGATRTHIYRIRNVHGGESEIHLNSLHHDENIEDKFKSTRFGMLLFDELDNFDSPDVFDFTIPQLRLVGLPHSEHLWLATCNPAEEGEESWIYKLWYGLSENEHMDPGEKAKYSLKEFTIDDNTFADESFVNSLKARYASDPEMYDRFILGKWTSSAKNSHFEGAFSPTMHVLGDVSSTNESKHDIILPSDGCKELWTGWDLGNRNHGVCFLEHVYTDSGDYWAILDEIVYVNSDISIEDMTFEAMERMDSLERECEGKVIWNHWSDRSAFDYKAIADTREYIIVHQVSNGRIELMPCPKAKGTVPARVNLIRRLFIGDRLFVSAHCHNMIEMFKRLKKGKTKSDYVMRNKHSHPFDAMSYCIYGESLHELSDSNIPTPKRKVVSI